MNGRKDTPLDRVLQALRDRRPDAYRAHPTSWSAWDAHCPACGGHRTLCIVEGNDGRVSLRCSSGCSPTELRRLLGGHERAARDEQVELALRHENTATWQHIADGLLRVIGDQQVLIAQLRAQVADSGRLTTPQGRTA